MSPADEPSGHDADASDEEREIDGEAHTRPQSAPGPYPDLMHHQLLTPRAPLPPGAGIRIIPLPRQPAVPARWAADPSGRHQWRWWNGIRWTEHVADDGEASVDPLDG